MTAHVIPMVMPVSDEELAQLLHSVFADLLDKVVGLPHDAVSQALLTTAIRQELLDRLQPVVLEYSKQPYALEVWLAHVTSFVEAGITLTIRPFVITFPLQEGDTHDVLAGLYLITDNSGHSYILQDTVILPRNENVLTPAALWARMEGGGVTLSLHKVADGYTFSYEGVHNHSKIPLQRLMPKAPTS